jgi:hypothetical protein
MTRSVRGLPVKPERGNSRAVAAAATAHRVRAMLDDVLAELEAERVRGGRDWRKKLVDDFHASNAPLQWLQQFREAAGVKDIEPGTASGNVAGATLAGIFAGAAARAAARLGAEEPKADITALPIIDVVAEPVMESDVQSKPAARDDDW